MLSRLKWLAPLVRRPRRGLCDVRVAIVSEAELMAGAGITELLLTSPVADPIKFARIVDTCAMVVHHVRQAQWSRKPPARRIYRFGCSSIRIRAIIGPPEGGGIRPGDGY
jgi:hypothetical protein